MNHLYIAFICCVLLVIISIKVSKNILSPEAIFLFVFLFSIICAIYSSSLWGFTMSRKTFFILLLGFAFFLFIALISKFNNKKSAILDNYKLKPIKIKGIHIIIFTIIYLLSSFVYVLYLCKTVNTYNLFEVGSIYRNMSILDGIQIPLIARLCLNVLRGVSTVLVCVIINNYLTKSFKNNHSIYLLFLITIYVFITLISGERISLLRVISFFILAYSVFSQRQNGFKKIESFKLIFTLIIVLSSVLFLFSTIRHFVGRSSELNLFDYISLYAGGPIYNINHAVNRIEKPTYNGHYTFLGFYNNLARLGVGEIKSVHRDVIRIESKHLYLGNVYTCFYDYYIDYGLVGVIVLISIYSFIINKLFLNAKYNLKKPFFSCVLYVFFGTTLFFVSFTEQFFSSYFAFSSFILIFIILVTIYILSLSNDNNGTYKVKLF